MQGKIKKIEKSDKTGKAREPPVRTNLWFERTFGSMRERY
jgi:hypothetical protein